MGTIAEILQEGSQEEIKQTLDNLAATYMPQINSFYEKADAILRNTLSQKSGIFKFSTNKSILEQMRDKEITSDNLNIIAGLQQARNKLVEFSATDSLNELNNLLGEGYRILTSFGEQLRGGRNIQYMITYLSEDGSTILEQQVVNLAEFTTDTFQLDGSGKIHLTNLTNKGITTNSFLDSAQWQQLLKFQQIKRNQKQQEFKDNKLSEIQLALERYQSGRDKTLMRKLFPSGWTRKRLYNKLDAGVTPQEIVEQMVNAIDRMYNAGRLIELGASLTYNGSDFTLEVMNEAYQEDTIAFYKQGDFFLKQNDNIIEYQSKLSNATINLSTIINGMRKLTSYFSELYNIINTSATSTINTIGNNAEEKAYKLASEKILKMFTV